MQRRLARSVGAPVRIGIDRRIAGNVDHGGAMSRARGSREGAKQRFGQTKRPYQVDGERKLQLLAFGIGQGYERDRPEARGVVDQYIEPLEVAEDLQGDWIDVVLASDIPDDSERSGLFGDLLDGADRAGDERDRRPAGREEPHQGKTQAGGSAGDRDAQA